MQLTNGKAATSVLVSFMVMGCGSNEPGSHWAGKTYLLDIPSKHWTQPSKDVGGEISPFVPQFLIGISGSGSSLTATVATAKDGVQNLCNRTQQTAFSESNYPASQFVLGEFPMTIQELNDKVTPNETITVHPTLHDMTFTNVLPGGETDEQGFTVTADIAELYPLFIRVDPQPPTTDSVCNALSAADSACQACAFNGKTTCLTLGAVQLEATPSSTTIKQVSVGDIAATCP
jgi:hypothetical protein